jgi:scyllo-inositol 2-dehydrogenase (NADP+)
MIRVGLIGFGMAGRVFHAPLISSVEGLELAAVVERHTDQAAARYPGIKTYRSLEAMLADATLDLFVVATPTGGHFEVTRQVLEAGKNVVADKPVAVGSDEIAQLMKLADARKLLLCPFHELRWNDNLRTIQKLLAAGSLGRLAEVELNWDRWRLAPRPERWKEQLVHGAGILLDLGTHMIDQALVLFGLPQAVSATITRERDGEGPEDAFTLRLAYPRLEVLLRSTTLGALARPVVHLRGTRGNYWKWGLDPQEAALGKITRIDNSQPWGQEPTANWGLLHVDVEGGAVTRPVEPIYGDYRLFYAGVRDALLGLAPAPVETVAAWRAARVIEWARESAAERREIACDWSGEPE